MTRTALVVRKRPPDAPRLLSFGQERLWYLDQVSPGNPVYNTPLLLKLSGKLDRAALQRAVESVMQRHEVLRTAFLSSGGRPVPLVPKKRAVHFREADLRHVDSSGRDSEASRLIKEESARPFDLARDPMLRVTLLQTGEDQFFLLCVVHHIVFEGSSVEILFRDLAAYYNAEVTGQAPLLQDLGIDFFDFSFWQRSALDQQRLAALGAYWKRQLSGAPGVDLPTDYDRPAVHTMRGAKYYFKFSEELHAAADRFFRESGTTSYRSLCAAFIILLYCYTGLDDISVGTPCTPLCRGIENLIGFFVNTVVLRVAFKQGSSFRQLIRKVDIALFGAITHSDLPLHMVVDAVQPARDPSRTPLFQVNFRAPQTSYPRLELEGIKASPVEVLDNGTAKFDLALEIGSFVNGASYIEYCSDLFKPETVTQMAGDFQTVLAAVIARPDAEFRMLPEIIEISQRARSAAVSR